MLWPHRLGLLLNQPALPFLYSVPFSFLSGTPHQPCLLRAIFRRSINDHFLCWALGICQQYPCFVLTDSLSQNSRLTVFSSQNRENLPPEKGDNLCRFFGCVSLPGNWGVGRGAVLSFCKDVDRSSPRVKTGQGFLTLPLSSCLWASNDSSSGTCTVLMWLLPLCLRTGFGSATWSLPRSEPSSIFAQCI